MNLLPMRNQLNLLLKTSDENPVEYREIKLKTQKQSKMKRQISFKIKIQKSKFKSAETETESLHDNYLYENVQRLDINKIFEFWKMGLVYISNMKENE